MASTTSTEAEVLKSYWIETYLKELESNLVLYKLGKMSKHPKNTGTQVHWLSIANLSAAAALTEATDPTSYTLSAGDITAGLTQFGASIEISDKLEETAISGYMAELKKKVVRNAQMTIDNVGIRDAILSGGGLAQYAGSAVARNSLAQDSAFYLTVDEVRDATRTLKRADVQPHTNGNYVCVHHVDATYDLMGDASWKDYIKYFAGDRIVKGHIGDMYGVSFIETADAYLSADLGSASADVYQSYVFGDEAFGISEFYNSKIIVKNPHPSSDLELYSTIGWKSMFAAKALQQSALIRIEHTSSYGT